MKERLTKKDKYGHWYTNSTVYDRGMTSEDGVHYEKHYFENKLSAYDGEPIDRLAEYEDIEEQGLMVRLPCKVGDKFYLIEKYPPDITEKEVCGFTIENGEIILIDENDSRYGRYWFDEEIVFTRAEAEKKLAELKGEK